MAHVNGTPVVGIRTSPAHSGGGYAQGVSSPGLLITVMLGVSATAAAVTSCSVSAPTHHHGSSAISSPNAQSAEHNPDDVAFAVNMMPHHQQGVELAAMVPSRTTNPELLVVAKHIAMDQQAEVLTFEGLLARWGEPADGHGGHSGHTRAMTMSGMVDPTTMNQLRSLRGAAFDELWISSMIGHHQGAITMAQNELAHGQSADAHRVAELIITAQRREIAQMNALVSVSE